MERAISFYRDVVGMEKVFDREFDEPMSRLLGVEGTRVRIVHMRLNNSVVELFDYYSPKGREPRPDPLQSDYGLIPVSYTHLDVYKRQVHNISLTPRFTRQPRMIARMYDFTSKHN